MAWRVGVDIGGTFTDVALVDEASGRIGVAKVPTTPDDFSQGVVGGLRQGLERHGVEAAAVSLLSHGCRTRPPSSPTRCWKSRAPAPGS